MLRCTVVCETCVVCGRKVALSPREGRITAAAAALSLSPSFFVLAVRSRCCASDACCCAAVVSLQMTDLRDALTRQQQKQQQQRRMKMPRSTPHARWRHDDPDAHFDNRDEHIEDRPSRILSRWSDPHSRSYGGRSHHEDSQSQVVELHEAMEVDVDQIDEIEEFVRRHLMRGALMERVCSRACDAALGLHASV